MAKAEFTCQGKFLWSLIKKAGWDRKAKGSEYSRFQLYILKRFKTTHINALTPEQMSQAISTMKAYADKSDHDAKSGLRQSIMAMVAKHGQNLDWLHTMMPTWGYGDSMRALSFAETVQVKECVEKALGVKK